MSREPRNKSPKSDIGVWCRWTARGGLSLIEVLIAIFVLAVGLMGVAALLPVAQQQLKVGKIDQRASDLAMKAFQSVETQKLDHPSKWIFANGLPFDVMHKADGVRYVFTVSNVVVGPPMVITFNGPPTNLADPGALNPNALEAILLTGNYGYGSAWVVKFISGDLAGQQRRVSNVNPDGTLSFWGEYYINDAATNTKIPPAPDRPFSDAPQAGDAFVFIRHQPFVVDPMFIANTGTGGTFAGMPRVSIAMPRKDVADADNDGDHDEWVIFPMGASMAESVFVSGDDLTFDTSDDPDLNSQQIWAHEPWKDLNEDGKYDASVDEFDTDNDVNGNGVPDAYRRSYDANFSWLAMFTPADAATSHRRYDLSIVVFHKRRLNATATPLIMQFRSGPNMRFGGGSTTLITAADRDAERMDELKPGQWILVRKSWQDVMDLNQDTQTGIRNVLRTSPVYRWYRLTSVGRVYVPDPTAAIDIVANPYTLDVTLDGGDWRTHYQYDQGPMYVLGSEAKAWIIEDVVGVFQRTIEVEDVPHGDYYTP